jgi:hypothetical protein
MTATALVELPMQLRRRRLVVMPKPGNSSPDYLSFLGWNAFGPWAWRPISRERWVTGWTLTSPQEVVCRRL